MLIKYTSLRDEFLSVAQPNINHDTLDTLKEEYKQQIDSPRKLSYVKDLNALLKLLEKRDILSADNIQPLYYISSKFINDCDLQNKLTDYKAHLQALTCSLVFNMYENEDASAGMSSSEHKNITKTELGDTTESHISQHKVDQHKLMSPQTTSHATKKLDHGGNCTVNVASCMEREEKLQQLVLSRVSEKLGRSWRDVVRHLGIAESQIDIIQNKYPFDVKEQSYEALKHCISQRSIDTWNLDLMRALENGRRKDLREIVEELTLKRRFG